MRTSTTWLKSLSVAMILSLSTFLVMVPAGLAQETDVQEEGTSAGDVGLGTASFILSIPYGVTKLAFALGGGIVGGLTYLFTGADEEAAGRVWTTSMGGTYIITPDHLRGDKAIRFLGVPDDPTMADASFDSGGEEKLTD